MALGAPGAPSEAFAGVPLAAAGVLAGAAAVYAALALPRPRRRVWACLALAFAIAVGLKLVAASAAPPVGLLATYWARATPDGVAERSTDFPRLADATRIEVSLSLRGEDFAVHFFNDAARFNFGPDVAPGRDQLPFSVRWQGWLLAPSDGERRFSLNAAGPASVSLDGTSWSEAERRVFVSSGLHALEVEYSRLEARVPKLELDWERTPGGSLVPVGGADVRWQPNGSDGALASAVGVAADLTIALTLIIWVGLGAARAWARRAGGRLRALVGAVPLGLLAYGMLLEAPLAGRATILSGLDDWLIYESSARDILLNGLLMDGGQGHAAPYYGQPLYPYLLALAHRLTGESLFGPLALQFGALGLVLVGTAALASRAFGTRAAAAAAFTYLAVLLQLEPEHFKIARQLFTENLYMPLVMASLLAVVALVRRNSPPPWWQALAVGVLLGATAISRSQFLLFVPFGLGIMLSAWRRYPLRASALGILTLAGVALAVVPVTARNWVVSGQLVPISSSGGASLLEFHRPPPGLIDTAALERDSLFNALHLDTQTRTVLAFARGDPRGYLATLLPLGAHSVGLQGRNDPGVYWPLLATVLLYLASFALPGTRRLHVWPIHAFIGTHLLVLMLFEADTYGYRLVMPMYAPMAAVAAQLPLAAVRALSRWRVRALNVEPAFAAAAVGAFVWQVGGLIEQWPERETALHGLGGPAAHAAQTADRVAADVIYVASIDGTPRRFGAGVLPGLRYPWFKWFDPARSLPLPPADQTALYMESELSGHTLPGNLVACLGPPDAAGERVISGADARQACLGAKPSAQTPITFDGLARIANIQVPDGAAAGDELEARVVWEPLVARPAPQQMSLQLDDPAAGDGTLWGNATLDLYPAAEWQPGEVLLSRLPVATDATALPGQYRVTLGIGPPRANGPGAPTARVPVAEVNLALPSSSVDTPLPPDMRAIEGTPQIQGGLELVGMRPLPNEAAVGTPLRIGLAWRAAQDGPSPADLKMRLIRANGDVVQEAVLPLLGGRVAPGALRKGSLVRDEESLVLGPRLPGEPLTLEVNVLNDWVRLGSVKINARKHVLAPEGARAEAVFGGAIELLQAQLEPALARPGDKVSVKLSWRAAAEMAQAYKVFVHVLDPSGERVVAQRDAEPQDGAAPTTGWLVGEAIEDEYVVALPAGLAAGDYPIEMGVYDPRSGERLALEDGTNRYVLADKLHVR